MTLAQRLLWILLFGLWMIAFGVPPAQGQGLTEAPLRVNQRLIQAERPVAPAAKGPLQLPFFDDFAQRGPFPDQALWDGFQVYVNDHFAIRPPTIGVATLEGLNSAGAAYNPDAQKDASLPVDTLSSRPINMANLRSVDSVVLSFYYQATGRGEAVNRNDSLVLEFLADSVVTYLDSAQTQIDTIRRDVWMRAWSQQGPPAPPDSFLFVRLQIPFDSNRAFYHDGFRFRFRAFGTATGAGDHWHLDYIYLDRGRDAQGPPVFNDIAVARRPLGFLTNFRRIPLAHYNADPGRFFRQTDSLYIRNLRQQGQTVRSEVIFRDVDRDVVLRNLQDIGARIEAGAAPGLNYDLKNEDAPAPQFASRNKALVEVQHRVNVGAVTGDARPQNDTVTFRQVLHLDYAYDDGSAESSFGFEEIRDRAQLALRFTPVRGGALQGVALMFNPFIGPVDENTFDVTIWRSIAEEGPATDDEVIHTFEDVTPAYPAGTNGFMYFELPEPAAVPANTPFYIGWKQTSNFPLFVGLDKNYNEFLPAPQPHPPMFFLLDENWLPVPNVYRGAPMIRAYINDEPIPYDPTLDPDEDPEEDAPVMFQVRPNPVVDGPLTLQVQASTGSYEVLSISGRRLIDGLYAEGENRIDLSSLEAGLYLLRILPDDDEGKPELIRVVVR